jgi:hypothetical protein
MNIVPVLKQVFVSFLLAFLGFGLNFVAKVIDDHLYVQTVKANPQLLADLLDVYFGFVIAALGYVIEKDISKGGKGLVVIVFVNSYFWRFVRISKTGFGGIVSRRSLWEYLPSSM